MNWLKNIFKLNKFTHVDTNGNMVRKVGIDNKKRLVMVKDGSGRIRKVQPHTIKPV